MNISKTAYSKFREKLQVCKDLMHGFDFSRFNGSPLEMAKAISGGVNFILDAAVPDRQALFAKEALLLRQAHSLCSSLTMGSTGGKALSLQEINHRLASCWMPPPKLRRCINRARSQVYPPEGVEDAINTVISQCGMWTGHTVENERLRL